MVDAGTARGLHTLQIITGEARLHGRNNVSDHWRLGGRYAFRAAVLTHLSQAA